MDPLLASFISETQDMLDELEEAMLSLEQDFQQESIDKIFRYVHTIKGNSGLFDLVNVTNLSHKFETVLNKLRNKEMSVQTDMIDVFLVCIDRLRVMVTDINNSGAVLIDDALENLERLLSGEKVSVENTKAEPGIQTKKNVPQKSNESSVSPKVARPEPELEIEVFDYLAEKVDNIEDLLVSLENNPDKQIVQEVLNELWVVYNAANEQSIENLKELSQDLLISLNLIQQDKLSVDIDTIDLFLMATDLLRTISSQKDGSTDTLEILNSFRKNKDINSNNMPPRPASSKANPRQLKISKSFFKRAKTEEKFLGLYRYQIEEADAESKLAELFAESCEVLQISKTGSEKYAVIVLSSDKPEDVIAPQERKPFNYNTLVQKESNTENEAKIIPPTEAKATPPKPSKELIKNNDTPGATKKGETHLKVPIDLIDQVINKAGETVISRNELVQKIESVRDPSLINSGKRISGLITQLQEDIMRTRMQQLNVVFNKVPRIVRDIERATGKKVELTIEGGDVDLDKTILDIINDPIMHMIRNSIDHGIEEPTVRLQAGKPAHGRLHISALLRGGKVLIKIQDDGKGLNLEKIKSKAIDKGQFSEEEAEKADKETISNLIFQPGFSTAEVVSTTSGRGVGMDVVRSNIIKAGGSVELHSEQGKGTLVTATLPQTLSIITCLIIKYGSRRFALPQQNIDRLILTNRKKISVVEERMMYEVADNLVPLFNLNHILNLSPVSNDDEISEKYVAIVKSEQHRYALLIDKIENPEEIVIKPLSKHFQNLGWFSGATIMGNGETILILDVPGVARELALPSHSGESVFEAKEELAEHQEEKTGFLAFRSFEQYFAVPLAAKPRIERVMKNNHKRFAGYDIIRHGDQIVPLLRLPDIFTYLKHAENDDQRFAILFPYGGQTLGILVSKIVNVVDKISNLDTEKFSDDIILGSTLIDGQPTIILDSEPLLKAFMKRIRLFSKAKELTLVRRKKNVKAKADV